MYNSLIQFSYLSLAGINLIAISSTINYLLTRRQSNSSRKNIRRKTRNISKDIEFFEHINPYLQGLTYAYSAYKLLNQQNDPVALAGTCIATGQLYGMCKNYFKK